MQNKRMSLEEFKDIMLNEITAFKKIAEKSKLVINSDLILHLTDNLYVTLTLKGFNIIQDEGLL